MLKKSVYYLIILLLAASCNSAVDSTEVRVGEAEETETISLDDYFSVDQVIQLETTDDVLLSHMPTKVRLFEDKLYVFDKRNRKDLFIFNLNGKLIKHINFVNADTARFKNVVDLDIIESSKSLAILDLGSRKVYFYDLDVTTLKSEKTIPEGYINMNYANGNLVFLPGRNSEKESGYFFEIWDANLKNKKGEFFPFHESTNGNFSLSHKFLNFGNRLSFWEPFNDTIYTYDFNKDLAEKLPVKFPNPLPSDLYEKELIDKINYVQNTETESLFINNAYNSSDFRFFNYISATDGALNFFESKDKSFRGKSYQLGGYTFETILDSVNEDIFYSILNMDDDSQNPQLILFSVK